jgi:hypothetical protein
MTSRIKPGTLCYVRLAADNASQLVRPALVVTAVCRCPDDARFWNVDPPVEVVATCDCRDANGHHMREGERWTADAINESCLIPLNDPDQTLAEEDAQPVVQPVDLEVPLQ